MQVVFGISMAFTSLVRGIFGFYPFSQLLYFQKARQPRMQLLECAPLRGSITAIVEEIFIQIIIFKLKVSPMSNDNNQDHDYSAGDSKVDAIAAVAVLSIIIVTVVYWLSTLG